VLGIFTKPVAFILSGEMAWAYFSAHAPNGFWPIMNRGELAALYSFLFLYFAARGGGAFSIDGLLKLARRRRARPGEVEGDKEEGRRGKKDDFPELTEDDLKEDPEIAELLGDNP
jgi:hypothetical protein